jgi:hypothetical protein
VVFFCRDPRLSMAGGLDLAPLPALRAPHSKTFGLLTLPSVEDSHLTVLKLLSLGEFIPPPKGTGSNGDGPYRRWSPPRPAPHRKPPGNHVGSVGQYCPMALVITGG